MAANILARFISNMTKTTVPKPVHVELRPYVRLEIPDEFQAVAEYVRIEINEDGDIEETVGLRINELEFDVVLGLEVVLGPDSGFDCSL
jgi:hypothetical protein